MSLVYRFIILSISALLVQSSSAATGDLSQTEKGAKAYLKKQFEKSRSQVVTKDSQKRELLSRIFHLNKKIKKMSNEKGKLQKKMFSLKSRAQRTARQIVTLENSIEEQKQNLFARARALYKLNGQSYLRVLFSSATPQKRERNMRFLSLLMTKDHELVQKYKNDLAGLKKKRSQLKTRVVKLAGVKNKLDKSEKRLFVEQKKKSSLVKKVEKERSWYLSRIKKLRTRTEGIIEEGIFSSSLFFEQRGRLIWPAEGRIRRDYGLTHIGVHRAQINHKGIELTHTGAPEVKSVFPGKIEYVGEIKQLGKVVVVNHSDHYYSIYGNLKDVDVVTNQNISQGEEIGKLGDLPNSKGLYFEVRHFSQPEDPKKWLRPENIQVSKSKATAEG